METNPDMPPKRRKAKGFIAGLCVAAMLAILFFAYLLPQVIRPANEYKAAQALLCAGQREEAMTAFQALNGYRDSAAQAEEIRKGLAYDDAVALFEAGQYDGAMAAFTALIGYRDSAAMIEKCQTAVKDQAYDDAVALYEAGQYEGAIAAFT
jgi:tetratricopeptide (TPR) repeat protein